MRETVCIHVGQCGNQIGNQFWNQLLHEHEHTADDDESLSAFFRFVPQRNGTKAMKARALLIDMESGPLKETMRSPLGSLFEDTQFVTDAGEYGSGNNFARGHFMYGPEYRNKFEEGIRRNAEHCDSLQTFLVTHSLGGGTGSGVGTYMLEMLSEEYPKICRFSTCVYPSENNDVVTSPYNVILASSELIEHADCVFPLDNTALFAFAQREKQQLTGKKRVAAAEDQPSFTGNTQNSKTGKSRDRGFDAINTVAARMLCHLTSSSRFHGEMNVDLNEIYTNLIPYPKLHFLITALSLQQPAQPPALQHGSAGAARDMARHGARAALQRAFGDVLAERGQIAAALPVQIPSPQSHLIDASGTNNNNNNNNNRQQQVGGCVTLSSAFLARGRSDAVPLTDFIDCVTSAQRSLRFPTWNQNACKVKKGFYMFSVSNSYVTLLFVTWSFVQIGMCGTPSPGEHMSVLAVYNR